MGPLIARLDDKDEDMGVRDAAAEGLVKIGRPAVAPLIACLKSTDGISLLDSGGVAGRRG